MQANIAKCEKCKSNNCIISKYCSASWKKLIDEHKTGRIYNKGEQIFYEGNIVFGIYFIYSGKVKVFKGGPNERRQIVRLAKPGDILGHRGFGGKLFYPIGATAVENSYICFIENDMFFKLLKENAELTFNLMLFYAEELKNSETRMRNLAQMTVMEKVAEALLMINEVYGKKENKGKRILDVILTRQEIADIAGTTQEQVIRTLSEFKKNHLIEMNGKQIIISNFSDFQEIIAEYENV